MPVTTKQFLAAEELSRWMSTGVFSSFLNVGFNPQPTAPTQRPVLPTPVPVGREPQPSPAVPVVTAYAPPAQLPPVRILPPAEPESEDDHESGWVEIPIPTTLPVFIPEPTRRIPAPPERTEPEDDRDFGEAIATIPIPLYPSPEPVIVSAPRGPVSAPSGAEGDEDMAIDWGDIFTTSVPQIIEGFVSPGAPSTTYTPVPAIQPSYSAMTAPGSPKCKRRRRRRLLTESDFNDLMRIATLPNKQNVAVALAKAVGRR